MELVTHGNTVFAYGPLWDDLRKFEEAFAKPEVDTLVLLNSPGGDLWTGLRVGRMLAEKKIKTVIGGRCDSACGLIFLGGSDRTFADVTVGTATSIGVHGAHSRLTGAINPEVQARIFAYMKLRIGDKFNGRIMNQALYEMDEPASMLRIFDKKRAPNLRTFHCRGAAPASLEKCTIYPDEDAMSLGLLTSDVTTHVELPPDLAKPPNLYGIALNRKIEDFDGYVRSRTSQYCDFALCNDMLLAHPTKGYHSALVFPSTGFGFVSQVGPDPLKALVAAIYTCNHRSTRPVALCEGAAVNEYDLAPWAQSVAQSHTDALSRLVVPSQTSFAGEAEGGESVPFTGLRTKNLSGMAPNTLAGVRAYSTAEIAQGLKSSERAPVLIDVDVVGHTIPTALALLHAGQAFDSATEDAAFEKRYQGLLQLLVPDPESPVVFFATSRETWTAANAALRAVKLGYKQVGWYRGGMQAWRVANLPLATSVLKAVASER